MQRHEERCTMNPNRYCGMCAYAGNVQPDLKDLIALLPKIDHYSPSDAVVDTYSDLWVDLDEAFEKLQKAAPDGCPACILAALRQANIPVHMAPNWDFEQACKDFLEEYKQDDPDYPSMLCYY
jgi:hypothetical protein